MNEMTWPVAAGSLLVGFAVAEVTGVRPLGGIVLVAAMVWCALRWRRAAGTGRTAVLIAIYIAAFAGSHVIAGTVGAWGAVLLAAAVVGVATWALADTRLRAAFS